MPYTNVWNDAIPGGGSNANTVDDHLRQLRQDIHERMDEALVVDWTADPVVAKAGAGGGGVANGKILLIPPHMFVGGISTKQPFYGANRCLSFSDLTLIVVAPIILPVGSFLRTVSVIWDRDANSEQWAQLRRHTYLTGTSTIVQVISHVNAGIVENSFTTINYEITGTEYHTIQVFGNGAGPAGLGHQIYGAKVVYDSPNGVAVY